MRREPEALADGRFDLLILGGGITGAGVALDAATRGLRVALIDKGDFASGTSSASSKLIHGGLRYLEHGEFHLVHEALQERGRLLENAPHLVQPLRFLLPFHRGDRVPGWKWRLALTLYDVLAGRGNIRRSRPLSNRELVRACPGLDTRSVHGGAEYYDAQMDDARVCIEVLKTAHAHGAVVANYVEATAFEKPSGIVSGVRAIDHVTGRSYPIRARQVLNATGPWIDQVCRLAGDDSGPHLQPTKGVHLIVPGAGLSAALLLLHPRDGRVFFVIPWLNKTLLGTTDTYTVAGPDALDVEDADVAYLLEGYNHFFRTPLDRRDVLGSFVGLRPLLRARPSEPSSLSREFRLIAAPSGLLSAAGGKFTTYRQMAEHITDVIVARLGCRRRCRTGRLRLDGAPEEPWASYSSRAMAQLCQRGRLKESAARHLLARYGRRALDVVDYLARDPQQGLPLHPHEPDLRAEISYQRDHEMALFPADHLLRRTRLGLYHPEMLRAERAIGRTA